jgi:predicted RNase H-like HicB family nuclease
MNDPRQWKYPRLVRPDAFTDGSFCYVAEHPDLPGCVAYGRTLTEAADNLELARAAYLTQLISEGASIPMPASNRADVEWQVEKGHPTADANEAPDDAPAASAHWNTQVLTGELVAP